MCGGCAPGVDLPVAVSAELILVHTQRFERGHTRRVDALGERMRRARRAAEVQLYAIWTLILVAISVGLWPGWLGNWCSEATNQVPLRQCWQSEINYSACLFQCGTTVTMVRL
jgi:hypothetical protein